MKTLLFVSDYPDTLDSIKQVLENINEKPLLEDYNVVNLVKFAREIEIKSPQSDRTEVSIEYNNSAGLENFIERNFSCKKDDIIAFISTRLNFDNYTNNQNALELANQMIKYGISADKIIFCNRRIASKKNLEIWKNHNLHKPENASLIEYSDSIEYNFYYDGTKLYKQDRKALSDILEKFNKQIEQQSKDR